MSIKQSLIIKIIAYLHIYTLSLENNVITTYY